MLGVLEVVPIMAKKRNDKSAKIDAWVLFMAETVVGWRKQTVEGCEKLSVAEYLSELVRKHITTEFESAKVWLAKQSNHRPGEEEPKRKGKA